MQKKTETTSEYPMRLNKYLAHKGYATRRSADTFIDEGRVFVNGKPAVLGQKVTESDRVEIQNLNTSKFRYILYHKPRGVITHSPEAHETDIVTQIKKDHNVTGVFPVGRLDKDSEGLIILTDDGRITERVLNPEHAHEREYEVLVDKRVTQSFLNALANGVTIERYKTKKAKTIPLKGSEHGFTIILTEGKKHQVRRMCAALGYQVRALKRTRMLSLQLKALKSGAYYALKKDEIATFFTEIGLPTL